jgi:hypothetical protein
MGTNTTNYNLYKPDIGETGWGADVNTSTDTVDTTLKANEDAIALNTTHRSSDGTDHANVVLNDTHRASDGTDHANVVLNDTHRASDGTDHANVVLNDTHRAGDGSDHADVATNTTHSTGDGSDHANGATNTTHSTGDGSDHADVASNTTHRTSDGSDHTFIDQSVISGAAPTFTADNLSDGGGNAIITTTQETNFETAYTHASSTGSDHSLVNSSLVSSINFLIDGGGSAITTGIKGDVEIPFACSINQVTMLADQTGSIQVDIWKDTYANFAPTDADSITAAAVPNISAADKSQDATLTGWTTSVTAGDILRFNVDSVATIERVTISLKITKT